MSSCVGGSKAPPRTIMRRNTHTECYINFRVLYQLSRVIYQLPSVLYQLPIARKRSRTAVVSVKNSSGARKRSMKITLEERMTYQRGLKEAVSKPGEREQVTTVAGRASDGQRQQGECQWR